MTSLGAAIFRGSIGLGLFAIITAGLIAFTQVSTADRIAKAQKQARAKALMEIVPEDSHDNDLLDSAISLAPSPLLGTKEESEAFIATNHGKPVAIILPVVAPDGYTGEINAIVGIRPDGTIQGVRITAHKETPGLGDQIEARKSRWIDNFADKSLDDPGEELWKVKKDGGYFDQLTGATITPRAVVGSIKKALVYFEQNRTILLGTALSTAQ
ncbi:electron transport complex subunit RsxG [Hahella sp. CCB-MM4]|uniref:electron transport complex subunit RsxG n=1 Tax=Hahella sp. (strain CCB-MM4) TaxID=1926491 RepID=UPI000B9A3A97|nr:electron transport complex subunit RsxG [Hahella sp. CCB-MM4]OZG72478.1 electron transport complex subunit RsxG [Hahella sp. CCB-MM4]